MKNHQSRLLLSTLLFLYLIARMLQPLESVVPHLLIVVLHVIPSALFALLHGSRIYRVRGILVFGGLCLGIATLFESVSLRTGFPFGHYHFAALMGPKISGLPILLALAYLGMGYVAWVVALALLRVQNRPLSGRSVVGAPLLASIVMTAWDLSMEAVWADIDRAWVWHDGGRYFGVPISNFLGWLLTTYVFYQLFALYLRGRESVTQRPDDWLLAVAFYAISALGNLLVTAPPAEGNLFIDATGKAWMLSSILWTSRAVSLLLMIPLSLFAWLRITQARDPSDSSPLP